MQQSPLTLRQRLIDAVDESYHVKDMVALTEILGTLEELPVTKELLETTRLGRTVNEFRKRINDDKLAKRAKALVKKWRDAVLTTEPPAPTPTASQPGKPLNGNANVSDIVGILRSGYNSNSSSPKLSTASSKISPNVIYNSNSLSPRILSNLTTNNNNLSRNGQNRTSASTVSSPGVSVPSSPSLRINSAYGKPLLGSAVSTVTTTSPQLLLTAKAQVLSNTYAPNAEAVARTNAANKRLRIDDEDTGDIDGPPLKKTKTFTNGDFEGALDDPSTTLDELSKDSFAWRASDNSDDGSLSKPVSNLSCGATLSGAPSPLSITQDSVQSPIMPLSVGSVVATESLENAVTCIEDTCQMVVPVPLEVIPIEVIPLPLPLPIVENHTDSAVNLGANADSEKKPEPPIKKVRRKKQNDYIDAETLLHQQIARAQKEGKIRAIHRLSLEAVDEERSRSPDMAQEDLRRAQLQSAALRKDEPVVKNEIVVQYLQSQNELRAKMERQYKDAVKKNEIILQSETPSTSTVAPLESSATTTSAPAEDPDAKKRKKKDKKKNKGEVTVVFPTESEILARLPPIDPQILEELKNFQFDVQEEQRDGPKSNPENETETLTSLNPTNETKQETNEPITGGKIDWGDSDDEDDFVEAPASANPTTTHTTTIISDGNDIPPTISSSSPSAAPPSPMEWTYSDENPPPLKEIEDAEIVKLHTEQIENLNGNKDRKGEFKDWHEVVSVESFKGDILHILPYTLIDF